jgi:hypothetical protein
MNIDRVFQNTVLRRIFGPKRDEVVTGDWRNYILRSLCDLYSSPKYNYNYEVNNYETGRARSTNREEEERIYVIGGTA